MGLISKICGLVKICSCKKLFGMCNLHVYDPNAETSLLFNDAGKYVMNPTGSHYCNAGN